MGTVNQNKTVFNKHYLGKAISFAIMALVLNTEALANEESDSSENQATSPTPQKAKLPPKNVDDIEVITVKGSIRESYEGAIGLKRMADTVIEAINSDDLGQFADDSIADAMQRIPGVQVDIDEDGTGGDTVAIRSLGPSFVNSTINGRKILSSGNEGKNLRKTNFNVFPSSILTGVKVAKGQTASRPESGIAGQVDLQTMRPLDSRKLKKSQYMGTISTKADYKETYGDTGVILETSHVWRNKDSDLGFYIGISVGESPSTKEQFSQSRDYKDIQVDLNGNGIFDEGEGELIEGVNISKTNQGKLISDTKSRQAYSAGIQWKPTEDIDISWDITSTRFDSESVRNNQQIVTTSAWEDTLFSTSAIEIDQDDVLRYADFSQVTGGKDIDNRIQSQNYNNYTENFITGLNLNYYIGQLSINLDGYYSTVDYSQDLRFSLLNKTLDKSQIIYDGRGDVPFMTTGDERLDPNGYEYSSSTIREIALDGDNYGTTLKFNYPLDSTWMSFVEFGLHYEHLEITSARSNSYKSTNTEMNDEIVAAALTGKTLSQPFLDSINFTPETWLTSNFDAIAEIDPDLLTTGIANLGLDYGATHNTVEEIFALFGQVNLDTEFRDRPLTGNIGLRAAQTTNTATGFSIDENNEDENYIPPTNTTSNDYWTLLPSFNLNWSVKDDVAVRLGLSRTLTRPEYSHMAPIITSSFPDGCDDFSSEGCVGQAEAGNPELKPMTSYNFDFTLEFYNQYHGAMNLGIFYKDVYDLIVESTTYNQPLPGKPADQLYDISQPVNFSDGEIKGYEISIYQPFDEFIPALAGFGFNTNYTRVTSSYEQDVGDAGFGFPGSSVNNFNFIGFYQNSGYSVRLAYVYRDEFFKSLAGEGSQTQDARFSGATSNLDFSLKLKPLKDLTVGINVKNILNSPRRDHIGIDSQLLSYSEKGRSYVLSVNYKL